MPAITGSSGREGVEAPEALSRARSPNNSSARSAHLRDAPRTSIASFSTCRCRSENCHGRQDLIDGSEHAPAFRRGNPRNGTRRAGEIGRAAAAVRLEDVAAGGGHIPDGGPAEGRRADHAEICRQPVPAVHWMSSCEFPEMAAARCSDTQDFAVPGTPSKRSARSVASVATAVSMSRRRNADSLRLELFSADGEFVLTALKDYTARLWKRDGTEVETSGRTRSSPSRSSPKLSSCR